jgi:hypothetical protein
MESEEPNREEERSISTTKRSWVWNHFTFDSNTKKAQCNHCQALITINKGSTSGLISHVKSKHGIMKDTEKQGGEQNEPQKSIEIAVSI